MSGGNPFGSPGSKNQGSAPGYVDPFSLGLLSQNTGLSEEAMANRYSQLGLGGSTAEKMDLGQVPSLVGGIPGMSEATLGQMQTSALSNATGSNTGGAKGSLGLGNLGNIAGTLGTIAGA